MKKSVFLTSIFCIVSSFVFAQSDTAKIERVPAAAEITAQQTVTLKGTIIDNMCAGVYKTDTANFVKTHMKECALMPDCAASGYSIFVDGKLMRFTKDSNKAIVNFLKEENNKLDVEVTAEKVDDELKLISIANQR